LEDFVVTEYMHVFRRPPGIPKHRYLRNRYSVGQWNTMLWKSLCRVVCSPSQWWIHRLVLSLTLSLKLLVIVNVCCRHCTFVLWLASLCAQPGTDLPTESTANARPPNAFSHWMGKLF